MSGPIPAPKRTLLPVVLILSLLTACSDRPALVQDSGPSAEDLTAGKDHRVPDLGPLDASSPDVTQPDMAPPDANMPDAPAADTLALDMLTPDMLVLDILVPDFPVPDMLVPDMLVPDMLMPDLLMPDMLVPDMPVPDMLTPDMLVPDMLVPDFPVPDLLMPDMLMPDKTPPVTAKSCKELFQKGTKTSGVYKLDPCGAGTPTDFYCDMSLKAGGWTVAGWQAANAKTTLGISDWGAPGATAWSRNLKCVPYSEIMVFNKTHGEAYSETFTASTWQAAKLNISIGPATKAFRHGTYGPSSSLITMGCVNHIFNSTTNTAWSCDSDSKKGPRGHIADYAGEYCPGGRLDLSKKWWTWTDGTTCLHLGTPYTWGFAIR